MSNRGNDLLADVFQPFDRLARADGGAGSSVAATFALAFASLPVAPGGYRGAGLLTAVPRARRHLARSQPMVTPRRHSPKVVGPACEFSARYILSGNGTAGTCRVPTGTCG